MNRKIISDQKTAIRFLLDHDMLDKIVPSPGKSGCVGFFNTAEEGGWCIATLNCGSWSLTILHATTEEAVAEYWQAQRLEQCDEASLRFGIHSTNTQALN